VSSASVAGSARALRVQSPVLYHWCDTDLDAGTITSEQQRIAYGTTVHVGPTKTVASRRTIPLDQASIRLLRQHRHRQRDPGTRTPNTRRLRA
jgi:hypothetical protein